MEDDLAEKLKGTKLSSDINVLLLGESGVGKSTFINAIANYCQYKLWKNAEKADLSILIPSKFNIRDKCNDYHEVIMGKINSDKNEVLITGESATQDVKTYVFPLWNGKTQIRLIDTPGIPDTRGIKQDDLNCENILTYISNLHEIHAICFIFKPNTSRISITLTYCVNQILSRLEKSASNNLIFVFTNTRGNDYTPGDTISCLKKICDEIHEKPPHVKIPLDRNIFCFDNEPLRYLAAVKQKIQFEDSVKQRNIESWNKSADEWWRLMKYIVGDANNAPLVPHFVRNTLAINEARRAIIQLSQPLADISQLINDNLILLKRQEDKIKVGNQSLKEARKNLYIPIVNLNTTKLTQPVTVCTSTDCSETYSIGGLTKYHYKQRCHDPCYLTNVPKEIIGSPELIHCAAINSSTKQCIQCMCDFSIHMHIYYMTETFNDTKIDEAAQRNITNKQQLISEQQRVLLQIKQRKIEYEREQAQVIHSTATFSLFLQTNAITPFNDSYQEYIKYLIERERALGLNCELETINYFRQLLSEYEQIKNMLENGAKLQKQLGRDDFVTPQKIDQLIKDLFNLKLIGPKVRELYNTQKLCRKTEHKFTEYVHKAIPPMTDSKKLKNKNAQDKSKHQKAGAQTTEAKKRYLPSYEESVGASTSRQGYPPAQRPPQFVPPYSSYGPNQYSEQSHYYGPHQYDRGQPHYDPHAYERQPSARRYEPPQSQQPPGSYNINLTLNNPEQHTAPPRDYSYDYSRAAYPPRNTFYDYPPTTPYGRYPPPPPPPNYYPGPQGYNMPLGGEYRPGPGQHIPGNQRFQNPRGRGGAVRGSRGGAFRGNRGSNKTTFKPQRKGGKQNKQRKDDDVSSTNGDSDN